MNTHLEQWAAIYAVAPGEQLGVQYLAQGHLSRGIEGRGSAVHSLPHLQFLPARDSNSQRFDYKSDPPLGHDFPMYAEIFQELTQHKVQHPQINCKNKKDAMHLFLWCIRYIKRSPFCQSVVRHNMEETVSVTLPLLLDKLRNDEDEPLGCLHLLPTAGRGNENHFNRCAPFHGQKGLERTSDIVSMYCLTLKSCAKWD